MDPTSMVDDRFEAGAELIKKLDAASFPVRDALWLYGVEEPIWQLWISSPLVDTEGPSFAYRRVRSVIAHRLSAPLSLSETVLVSPKHPLLQSLRRALRTGPGISGIRFSRNTIDGRFIEDAYIYRLN